MKVTLNKQAEIAVNLGNYQNIHLQSGITQDVEVDSPEKMAEIQAKMAEQVAEDLRLSLWTNLEILGQKPEAAASFANAAAAKCAAPDQTQTK
jgi:hypothetical protein